MTGLTPFLAGLLLGLSGSGHCAVMCGPLVAAFGRRGTMSGRQAWRHTVSYHAGRLATYLLAGLIAGVAGQTLATLGLGRVLAVALGVLIVISAVLGTGKTRLGQTLWSSIGTRLSGHAIAWSRRHPVAGPALMGAANGLLPCGLLYAAVAAAAGFGQIGAALFFTTGFGLGTIPALIVVTSLASWLPGVARRGLAPVAPLVLASVGMLLIARGFTDGHEGHRTAAVLPTSALSTPTSHVHVR